MIDQSESEDRGLAVVVIARFKQWILPRALEVKARVERGERLSDYDIDFLEELMKDAEEVKRHVDRAPEYQTLYTRVVSLYGEITKKALENEQTEKGSSATG